MDLIQKNHLSLAGGIYGPIASRQVPCLLDFTDFYIVHFAGGTVASILGPRVPHMAVTMFPETQKAAMPHQRQMKIWGYDCLEARLGVPVIVVPLPRVLLNYKGQRYAPLWWARTTSNNIHSAFLRF